MEGFYSEYISVGLRTVSALILFMFAASSLTAEIQHLATEDFGRKISKFIKNRFGGVVVGFVGTMFMQSSTAMVTVAIALVNTGVISFRDSLAVIFGSSIGTTITSQLALISSVPVASILLIVGFISKFLGKRFEIFSKTVFYLGFILFSLNLLSSAVAPLKDDPDFVYLFSTLSSPIVAYIVSTIFTILLHSSSITTSIVVILCSSGVLPLSVAIPMILGANLGTSVSGIFTTKDMNLYARRAAFANVFFKVIGTLIFMFFVPQFAMFLTMLTDDVGYQSSLANLLFNVANTMIFLIFMNPFEKLVTFVISGDEEEILFETRYIDEKSKSLEESISNIVKEIGYSVDNTMRIFKEGLRLFWDPSGAILMGIDKFESLNDFLDDRITESIVALPKNNLSKKEAVKSVILVKISNTIEQLGDLGMDFSRVFVRVHKMQCEEQMHITKVVEMFNMLMSLFEKIKKQISNPTMKKLESIKIDEEKMYAVIRSEFDNHVKQLQVSDGYSGDSFVEVVSIMEASVSKLRDIRKLLMKQIDGKL